MSQVESKAKSCQVYIGCSLYTVFLATSHPYCLLYRRKRWHLYFSNFLFHDVLSMNWVFSIGFTRVKFGIWLLRQRSPSWCYCCQKAMWCHWVLETVEVARISILVSSYHPHDDLGQKQQTGAMFQGLVIRFMGVRVSCSGRTNSFPMSRIMKYVRIYRACKQTSLSATVLWRLAEDTSFLSHR